MSIFKKIANMIHEYRMNKLAKDIALSIIEEQTLLNNSDSCSADMDDNIIVLNDENGHEVKLEFLDLIPYQGQEYVIFLPVNSNADEIVILQLEEDDDGTENYLEVEDERIVSAVFNIFKDNHRNEFNFVN